MDDRKHRRVPAYLTGLLFLALCAACARLPEYARPQLYTSEGRAGAGHNSFAYRQLTRADFQATALPEPYVRYNHRIQARSCISIRPADDTVLHVTNGAVSGQTFYLGNVSRITFRAMFNPDCSWWSPDVPTDTTPYVLQHEQIHFGLAELTARRLNREARSGLEQYLAIGKTPQQVQAELVEKVESVCRAAMEQEIEQHTSFDEETSLSYDPKAQQKWFVDITRRLSTTGAK